MAKRTNKPKAVASVWPGNPSGDLRGKAKSAVKQPKAKGIKPSDPSYGITDTSRKHTNAVTVGTSTKLSDGQKLLSAKAKRQVQ